MFTFLFPGQGSQTPGMGKFLFDNFKVAQEVFEEVSDAIKVDLKRLCFSGSEEELALTENTQPALLCVSTATQKVLTQQFNIHPIAAAGHSIGEYAALVAADVISLYDASVAVRIRGQAMQAAVPVGKGGMLATLGLEDNQVRFLCEYTVKQSGFGPLSPANFNSPGQVVISGDMRSINWIKDNFKPEIFPTEQFPNPPKRAKLIALNVSAPFHCEMMKPAEEKMRMVLEMTPFADAKFPIVQNFLASPVTISSELRENIIRQVSAPVLWTQCMLSLKHQGFTRCIEVGNGKVLSGLAKKIDPESFQVFSTNSIEDLKLIEETLKT